MIDQISRYNQAVKVGVRFTRKKAEKDGSSDLFHQINSFLLDYCNYYDISPKTAAQYLYHYSKHYLDDLSLYHQKGVYPVYLKGKRQEDISRQEYEVFLISSYLFTRHRFSIAEEIMKNLESSKEIAVIGAGPGVEIELLFQKNPDIDVYDLQISEFLKKRYPSLLMHDHEFDGGKRYDLIIAIELLEHIRQPYSLIEKIFASLPNHGIFMATIASDVPQFDHVNNFVSSKFESNVTEIGFSIKYSKYIPHDYYIEKGTASNTFYILEKI